MYLIVIIFQFLTVYKFFLSSYSQSSTPYLPVAGIFEEHEYEEELAFKIAIMKANRDVIHLPNTTLQTNSMNVDRFNSLQTESVVCNILNNGTAAIIGPSGSLNNPLTTSICDAFEIPHIQFTPELKLSEHYFSVNMYPSLKIIAKSIIDLIRFLDWSEFVFLYEDDEDITFVDELFKENQREFNSYKGKSLVNQQYLKWKVKVFQFTDVNSYRATFWQIRTNNYLNIVLCVKSSNLYMVLKQAQQIGLMTDRYTFILTSLDLHTIEIKDFKYSRAKMYSYRMTDESNSELRQLIYEWKYYTKEFKSDHEIPQSLKTSTSLVYDAVKLLAYSLQEANKLAPIQTQSLSCQTTDTWSQGTTIINYLTSTPLEGITGNIFFDENGFRSNVRLHLYMLSEDGLQKAGTWTDFNSIGLNMFNRTYPYYNQTSTVEGHTLKVITALVDGFLMIRKDRKVLTGNERYRGYVVDLVEELSIIGKFKYEIILFGSKNYGACFKETMTCTGMLGEITSGNAHMALVDLTITSERGDVVDFTHPFINTGIALLFKKITRSEVDLFGFLAPFTKLVWMVLLLTVLGISLYLHFIGRLSPYEWTNPYPCREQEDIQENDFNISNSAWFIFAALTQQGSEYAPKTLSTRWLAGVWYFFTLILVSCYTANLAASLAVENFVYPIKNAKDLVTKDTPEVKKIRFGCKATGSTISFFNQSTDPEYRKIMDYMRRHPEDLAADNDDGERRVTQSQHDYAYFIESATMEYKLERNCDLKQIGGLLDNKGYGIAVKQDSVLLGVLNRGLLKLQEDGKLQTLYDRWWKQRDGGGICMNRPKPTVVTAFSLINVGGVFIVLVFGILMALLIAVCELAIKLLKEVNNWETFLDEMKDNIKFAFTFRLASKPNKRLMST